MANLTGYGAPTDLTEGNLGDIYRNLSNDVEYECVDIHEIRSDRPSYYYTWIRVTPNTNLPSGNPGQNPAVNASAIIDVFELPTENINENAFYRLPSGSMVVRQEVFDPISCHCVNVLPSSGLPAFDPEGGLGHVYYVINDRELYCYIDSAVSAGTGLPTGWGPAATFLEFMSMPYAGVITNILDDPIDGASRLLLEYVTYSYKDGWHLNSPKTIGWVGAGLYSEIFNTLQNTATGYCSHAEGRFSEAEGSHSHAEGYSSHAEGTSSHAEGDGSHAEGNFSHAEGCGSHAAGGYSHAEGYSSNAEGVSSHAEGTSSRAKGESSHAEGNSSHAEGNASHAEGYATTATGRCQHTQGEYNLRDPISDANNTNKRGKYAHIVGNGTSSTKRSNAHTLDWSGNAWYQGDVYVGGSGQDDATAEKLAKLSDLTALSNELKAYIDDLLANNT